MSYKIKLIKKDMIADGTMAFYFEKPVGFSYQAGQYADFTLINPPETDDEGDKRTFSFSSAPFEPELRITTRLRDTAFKRVLRNLPIGSELTMDGPYGSFALPSDLSTPAVLLAGGIGATFARSMIAQAAHEKRQQDIVFLWANRAPSDAPYLEEFTRLATQNVRIHVLPTMTDLAGETWDGQRGDITIDLIKKHVPDVTVPVYYLAGSGAMVGAMRTMLLRAGVNKFNIRSDQFIGY